MTRILQEQSRLKKKVVPTKMKVCQMLSSTLAGPSRSANRIASIRRAYDTTPERHSDAFVDVETQYRLHAILFFYSTVLSTSRRSVSRNRMAYVRRYDLMSNGRSNFQNRIACIRHYASNRNAFIWHYASTSTGTYDRKIVSRAKASE